MAEIAARRREWASAIRSMPIFRADRAAGQTWRYHRQAWVLWDRMIGGADLADVEQRKIALCHSLQGAASRAVQLHGPDTPGFNGAATLVNYLDLMQGVFQPPAETAMARMDFEGRNQEPREPIGEYMSDKYALYLCAEPDPNNQNFAYLRSHILKGIHSKWVQQEVIRAAPTTKEELQNACMTAVGQAREAYHLGVGVVTSLDGLASTTMQNRYLQPRGDEPMDIGKVEDRTCYNCKRKGHLAADCRSKSKAGPSKPGQKAATDIICHYCSKKGHKRPDCRKLKKDKAEGKVVDKKPPPKKPAVRKVDVAEEEDEPDSDEEYGGLNVIYDDPDFHQRGTSTSSKHLRTQRQSRHHQ